MYKKFSAMALAVACVLTLGLNAQAEPIRIGTIWDGIPPSAMDVWMNTFLSCPSCSDLNPHTIVSQVGNKSVSQTYEWWVTPLPGSRLVSASDSDSWSWPNPGARTVSGWEYLAGKYDGPNAGTMVWYLGGETFTVPEFEPYYSSTGYALSGWYVFNSVSVPDGGSVVMLLGAAMFGLAGLRRLLK